MKPIQLSDKDVRICLNHKPKSGLPVEFMPNEPFHFTPRDAWDIWENRKYKEHAPFDSARFCSIKAFVFRQLKLMKKREFNKYYCLKNNPKQPRYIYDGLLIKEFHHASMPLSNKTSILNLFKTFYESAQGDHTSFLEMGSEHSHSKD